MAIITCPECRKKISSVSKQCINCGYPIDVLVKNPIVNNIILDATIEQLNLSLRAYRALKEAGVRTVRSLTDMDINNFMAIKNLGKKSLLEIEERLLELGLCIHDEYKDYESKAIKSCATKWDWNCERAPENVKFSTVMYAFNSKELEIMRIGRIPTSMEQKWFYYYDNGAIYFYRSWTGKLIFSLILNEQTNKHTLITYYNDEKELEDFCKFDIIELIQCLINNL